MGDTNSWIFRFYVDDEDPEAAMFGCTANSLAEAEDQCRAAGHRQFTLYDQSPVDREATSLAAQERIDAHPFLGPDWFSLVDVVSVLTHRLKVGQFWTLDTYGRKYDLDPHRSPYVQAMFEPDGSLHVEIAGRDAPNGGKLDPKQYSELELLGWTSPADGSSGGDTRLPNSYRVFEPGWSARGVAEAFLEALAMVFEITTEDFFNFGEDKADLVESIGLLERIDGGPIFSLNMRSDSAESPNPDEDAPVSIDKTGDSEGAWDYWTPPEKLDQDVAEAIRAALHGDDLEPPYIPESFGDDLVNFDGTNFGMDYRPPFDPSDLYKFHPMFSELLGGDWIPRVQFGFSGHGMNSYAWSYVLVADGLAIIGQTSRGLAYANPERTSREWADLMSGARTLHYIAQQVGESFDKELFVVFWSPLRGVTGWRVLEVEELEDEELPGFDMLDEERRDEDRESFFARAAEAFIEYRQQLAADLAEDDFGGAQELFDKLLAADFVDIQGRPNSLLAQQLSADDLQAGGKKYGWSEYLEGDADAYYALIDIWDEPDFESTARAIRAREYKDENNLVCVAGAGWSVVVTRGERDTEVPGNVAEQLLAALPDGALVWERPIPEAEWFESKFATSRDIVEALLAVGLNVESSDSNTAFGMDLPDAYLVDCISGGDFSTATLQLPALPSGDPLTLHIMMEDNWAEAQVELMDQHLPVTASHIYVAGDGWVVRIITDRAGITGPEKLKPLAEIIATALEGKVFESRL